MHNWQVVHNPNNIAGNTVDAWYAPCPTGTEVIGGGAWSDAALNKGVLKGSYPGNSRWYVAILNQSSSTATFTAFAVCFTRFP
jgi:hypothetical protein